MIQTSAPSQTTASVAHSRGLQLPLAIASLLLLFLPRRTRHWSKWLVLPIAACLLSLALSSCGSSGTLSGGTPVGDYSVTVTGTAVDGTITITKTATVSIAVKSLF